MPFNIGAPELIIIAVVILVLFGAKKMPDAARSLGRSMRILKSETKGLHDDDDDDDEKKSSHSSGQQQSDNPHREQGPSSAQPQQLSTAPDEQPVVDGRVVDRDQTRESHQPH